MTAKHRHANTNLLESIGLEILRADPGERLADTGLNHEITRTASAMNATRPFASGSPMGTTRAALRPAMGRPSSGSTKSFMDTANNRDASYSHASFKSAV